MAYSTEELWFTEWEQGGDRLGSAGERREVQPGESRREVEHADAHHPRARVIIESVRRRAWSAFTALQRKRHSSRLLIFPDENHWCSGRTTAFAGTTKWSGWLNGVDRQARRDNSSPEEETRCLRAGEWLRVGVAGERGFGGRVVGRF